MKLKIGGLYQLKSSIEELPGFTHPYRKESNGIVVYKIKNVVGKLHESIEFKPGTPAVVVSKTDKEKYVSCLIEDKLYEVHAENLIKLS